MNLKKLYYATLPWTAPLKCQLLVILLFGILNPNVPTFVPKTVGLHFAIEALQTYCPKLERWEFEAVHLELENILDHLIYRLAFQSIYSTTSFRAVHAIGSVLQLYGNYLQHYHGPTTDFHGVTKNIFCIQHLPGVSVHTDLIQPLVSIELISIKYPVLVCCTSAIHRPVQYRMNRLVQGLCYSQSQYEHVSSRNHQ
ncbi:hypothetical protein FGIG_00098 [Fasciola gigantica]|uniref:Uncharacterized protein n=1 Tax=Fasciola gigantica TaxID=46835 RepID=A0A504YK84_FASGI|nr:hypothetical protein FGIG_00098 [Fasciola gigantica]